MLEKAGIIICKPLTMDNWNDLEDLFGPHGADGGCWCMFFRLAYKDFHANRGLRNKELFKEVVGRRQPVGLLAYNDEKAVGWIAIAPRNEYPRLDRSRNYKAIDTIPVWSITCFFTAREYRRKGVTRFLIKNAIRVAGEHGAEVVEAYPVDPKGKVQDAGAYTGLLQVFLDIGFTEVARRSPSSPVVRFKIMR